jgi:hypothetical protein
LIDTAPRDGKFVILEEDASGKYNVACWSLEAGGWVAESGEPIKIAPMYWHPIGGQKYAQQGLDPDFSLRPDPDAPQQTTASAVAASRTVAPAPVTAAELELRTIPTEIKRAWPTRLKFAASAIAASLVVAVFAVMHFLEVGSHVTRYASLRDSVEVSTIGEQGVKQAGQPSENEQGQKVLAEELANARLAVDELNQKLRAEAAAAAQSLAEEHERTVALTLAINAAREALTANTAQHRQALEDERARTAALTGELTTVQREIKTQAEQSQKAVDAAAKQKQAAEAATVELRQSLQQEQTKTAALVQEAKTTQASTASVEPERRALEEAHRQALEDERARTAALTGELTTVQREIETQAAQSQKAVDEALQQKQAAEAATADLRQSLQQERQRVDMLSSEVRQKLKALAKLSRQESDKTASNQAADANAELRPSLPRKRGQRKGGTPDAETPGQSTGTAATEQGEPAGLLTRAKALVGQGNIRAARDVLELAVGTGSAQATFALAETYDPNVLATWRTRGTLGDVTKARDLYKKAYDAGIEAAKDRSQALVFSDGERKPASWFGREETVR